MIAWSRGRDRLITLAWRGEEELLSPRVRRDSERFRQFLADDFHEIGLQLGQQHSRHSSLWRVSKDSAQCIFHQGTPASDC